MQRFILLLSATVGVLFATHVASAHSFICEKTVNGMNSIEVSTYPTTLHYAFTVINNHPTDASTAQSASDAALASYGFSFSPQAPFTVPVGQSITDEFDIVLETPDDCLKLAAADGTADDRFMNTFVVTFDSNSAQCSAVVVCVPPPPEGGATRTPGFFKTHEDAMTQCLDEGSIDLGFITIDTLSEALGLLWGSPATYDNGEHRSMLDKARFILGRHTLVATCNERLFGTQTDPINLIEQAVMALSGTDCELMHELADSIDDFNNSGDEEPFPSGFQPGPATPRHAAGIADDPTDPSNEQCSD